MGISMQNPIGGGDHTGPLMFSESDEATRPAGHVDHQLSNQIMRGPGWSPPPMGFGMGILITGGNL